jgi:opacity protein-like surface antigen
MIFSEPRAAFPARALLPLVLIVALLSAPATATAKRGPHQVGIGFLVGFPEGELDDEVDENGYGLGGHYVYTFGRSGLGLGLDIGYLIYGTETRREPFSTTIPDVTVEVTNQNQIFMSHLLLRYSSIAGRLQPHVDGLVGLKYLYTETKIEGDENDEPIARDTNFDDTAFSYGFGAGLKILLHESAGGSKSGDLRRSLLTLHMQYLFGSEADYLKKGSIHRTPDGRVAYDVHHSRTDILTALLGFVFEF